VAQYHANTLHALKELLQAAGLMHPDQLSTHHIVRRIDSERIRLLSAIMPTLRPRAILDDLEHQHNVYRLYWPLADAHSFAPHIPAAHEWRSIDALRPTVAGRPASAVQIAEELTHRARRTPAPSPGWCPSSPAHRAVPTASTPTHVPREWTASGDAPAPEHLDA
jgi:hypothetical protein